jgi:hypothetical protein
MVSEVARPSAVVTPRLPEGDPASCRPEIGKTQQIKALESWDLTADAGHVLANCFGQ